MPWRPYEEDISENTSDEMLHRIVQAGERTSDPNVVRAVGEARAELERRKQVQRTTEQKAQRDFDDAAIRRSQRISVIAAAAAIISAIAAVVAAIFAGIASS